MYPSRPIPFALVGLGARARKLYLPLLGAIAPWLRLVAVCTPDASKAERTGRELGVATFTSLRALTDAGLAEAALVVSSIDSHHAISTHLSRHRVHHLVETPMSALLAQAEDMVAQAERNGVALLVAENYIRFPFDRLARKVVATGAIGDVSRVTCFQDQPGYHGTSRWIRFFDGHPHSVQAIRHRMETEIHVESPRRVHDHEMWRTHVLHFPGNRMAMEMGGNPKGMLGRTGRPGHTEICGTRGAIVRESGLEQADTATLRICSDEALRENNARADIITPFRNDIRDGVWLRSSVDTPNGRVEWVSESRPPLIEGAKVQPWDAPALMEVLTDFAEHVAGARVPEFTLKDALATMRAEAALSESAAKDGARIGLPDSHADLETEKQAEDDLRQRLGADPLDGNALLDMHFAPAA